MTPAACDGKVDVLVIGAGVAGGCAAISAARHGSAAGRVLLVDHSAWPRDKVCGGCLGSVGLATLRRLGVDVRSRSAACVTLDRVRVIARGGASFEMPHAGGEVVTRSVLDDAIVRTAVAAGAVFRPRCTARVVERLGDVWHVRLGDEQWTAGVVVVADGVAGRSLSMLGECSPRIARSAFVGVGLRVPSAAAPPEVAPEGTVQLVHGIGGYVGLARCADGSIDVAAAISPVYARSCGGPVKVMRRILDEAGVPLAWDTHTRVMGTPALTRRRSTLGAPGLVIVGDAAGYVEPFTGEGMTWAAVAGEQAGILAAQAVRDGAPGLASLGRTWEGWHRRNIVPMQRACRLIRALLRIPGLVRGVAEIARRSGTARSALAGISMRMTGASPGLVAARQPRLFWGSPSSTYAPFGSLD